MRQKLLVLELWGLGDLIIGSHFLRSAAEQYDVTVVAKPYWGDGSGRRSKWCLLSHRGPLSAGSIASCNGTGVKCSNYVGN
jgi:hypothetical protein